MKKRLALFALLVAGCGNNTTDVDSFIQNVATEQCSWEFRCCKDSEIKQQDGRKFTTMDDCVPYHKLQLQNQWYLDRLAASQGRLRVDTDQASTCIAQMDGMVCNPKPGAPPMMTNPMMMDACATVFVGATPVGNECVYEHECVDGAHCISDAAAVGRGVCVPFQEEGDICNDSTDCDPKQTQLYCAKVDYHCHLRAQLGQKCMVDTTTSPPTLLLECDTTGGFAFCDPSASVCRKLPGDGEACLGDPLPPGVTSRCNPDPTLMLTCDTAGGGNGVCRAPGQLGQDCTSRACATGLYCDSQLRTCKALPDFGQPCAAASYQCKMPYFCNSQKSPPVCDQPASVGQDCAQTPCDTGLYCKQSTTGIGTAVCTTQLPDGAVCTGSPFDECASNDCSFGPTGTQRTCQPHTTTTAVLCSGR
jgi:hypothetical protein